MKVQLYGIFDTAAGIYQKPFFGQSDGEVKRSFMDVAVDKECPIGKHPEDYSLYRLGTFDDNSGTLLNEDNECLMTAHEAIAASRKTNGEESFPFNTSKEIGGLPDHNFRED